MKVKFVLEVDKDKDSECKIEEIIDLNNYWLLTEEQWKSLSPEEKKEHVEDAMFSYLDIYFEEIWQKKNKIV